MLSLMENLLTTDHVHARSHSTIALSDDTSLCTLQELVDEMVQYMSQLQQCQLDNVELMTVCAIRLILPGEY